MAKPGKKTVGILGGMGPESTSYFYERFVQLTPAACDQDHIPALIYSNTEIPDRTESILAGTPELTGEPLIRSAKLLRDSGADFLVIVCNTAHYWIEDIRNACGITVLDMIGITARKVKERGLKKAGLISTRGAVKTGLYQNAFKKHGIGLDIPDDMQLELLAEVIAAVKSGRKEKKHLATAMSMVEELTEAGAGCVVLGCTELQLLFNSLRLSNLVFPLDLLVVEAVRFTRRTTVQGEI